MRRLALAVLLALAGCHHYAVPDDGRTNAASSQARQPGGTRAGDDGSTPSQTGPADTTETAQARVTGPNATVTISGVSGAQPVVIHGGGATSTSTFVVVRSGGPPRSWFGMGLLGSFSFSGASGAASNDPAQIQLVFDASPAKRAGLQPGDVITSIDGTAVSDAFQARRLIRAAAIGQTIQLGYRRGEEQRQVALTAVARPSTISTVAVSNLGGAAELLAQQKRLIQRSLTTAESACAQIAASAAKSPEDGVAQQRAELCRKEIELTRQELKLELEQLDAQHPAGP